MKKLYILCLFAFSLFANAQIVNIPDANFKAALLNANPSDFVASTQIPSYDSAYDDYVVPNYNTIDVNGDGEIQISEAQLIKYLDISYTNISSLTGIEAFVNLISLRCNSNNLSSFNITQNIFLKALNCNTNQLTILDVSQNSYLEYLNCFSNSLTSLNVLNNSVLKILYFEMNNLSSINILNNPILIYLSCGNNPITSLNLSNNVNLEKIYCNSNQLTSLDVSNNIALKRLYCYSNQLITLDLSQNSDLEILLCNGNQIETLLIKNNNLNWNNLNFSNNPNLQYICADEDDLLMVQQKIIDNGYTNCHVNSYCSFTPNGTFYEISGNTKFDFNTNGCDVTDINYSNLNFSISDGVNTGSMIANQTGNYYIPVQAGIHTIAPNFENPSYFTISPTSFTVDFPSQASPFAQDFCVTANGVHSDVEVMVLSTVPARPGFDANYKIVYRNKGNQIENGSVALTFEDAVLDYVSSNPTFSNSSVNTYSWNYTNLQPFETREIEIVFNVNGPTETPAVNNDDILNYTASITTSNTDETISDNTFTLNQTVVGSYDPNDKTCLEGEIVGTSMVGKYVHYVIRFENTGTFPAENIVVKDMIDLAKFDIATLVPLKGSHEFYTRIKDNKVEFIFENINLDFNDATNDGYVAFKIKTKSTLVIGDTFSNDANIYFDYNFPITTNTYTTTIAALSTQNFEFGSEFTLYPNPAKDVLNIQSKNSLEIQSIEIYNILGQVVLAVPNATNAIDVSNLTKGNYFIKVNTNNGTSNTKFIKE